jgi:transcriptional regulator with XRE-family HTH domain
MRTTSNRLASYMKRRKINVRAMAARTGLPVGTISGIKNGQIRVTDKSARKLASVLGCVWHTLVTDSPERAS